MSLRTKSIITLLGALSSFLCAISVFYVMRKTVPTPLPPSATVSWKGKMTFAPRGELNYMPPADVENQLELDWNEIVRNCLSKPYWLLTSDQIGKYSISSAQNRSQPRPGDSYLVTSASSHSMRLAGCNEDGDQCKILDTWDGLVDNTYTYPAKQIVSTRSHFRDNCDKYDYTATLAWQDGRWKILGDPDINCVVLTLPGHPVTITPHTP